VFPQNLLRLGPPRPGKGGGGTQHREPEAGLSCEIRGSRFNAQTRQDPFRPIFKREHTHEEAEQRNEPGIVARVAAAAQELLGSNAHLLGQDPEVLLAPLFTLEEALEFGLQPEANAFLGGLLVDLADKRRGGAGGVARARLRLRGL
jgi:hypothetical protein